MDFMSPGQVWSYNVHISGWKALYVYIGTVSIDLFLFIWSYHIIAMLSPPL